jgi:hypothetical protein
MSLTLGELAYPLDETIQEFFRAWQDEDGRGLFPSSVSKRKSPSLEYYECPRR